MGKICGCNLPVLLYGTLSGITWTDSENLSLWTKFRAHSFPNTKQTSTWLRLSSMYELIYKVSKTFIWLWTKLPCGFRFTTLNKTANVGHRYHRHKERFRLLTSIWVCRCHGPASLHFPASFNSCANRNACNLTRFRSQVRVELEMVGREAS
jgi:hypothetical protein